jgi:hypothetical protein
MKKSSIYNIFGVVVWLLASQVFYFAVRQSRPSTTGRNTDAKRLGEFRAADK